MEQETIKRTSAKLRRTMLGTLREKYASYVVIALMISGAPASAEQETIDLRTSLKPVDASNQLLDANNKMTTLFDQGLPNKHDVLDLQNQINSLLAKTENRRLLSVLPADQSDAPPLPFERPDLNLEQLKQINERATQYASKEAQLQKELDLAQFDFDLLYGRVDFAEVEAQALRTRIASIQSARSIAKNDYLISVRKLLTPEQSKKLFDTHRDDLLSAVGITESQSEKLMMIHCKIDAIDKKARREVTELEADQRILLVNRPINKDEVLHLQERINSIRSRANLDEIEQLYLVRECLSPEQRSKLVLLNRKERETQK